MIKLEIIKYQLEKTGMSSYALWKYTKIPYSSINNVLNAKSPIKGLKTTTYEAFMTLFTKTEKLLAEQSDWGVNQYKAFWIETLKLALDRNDVQVVRSGAVYHNEKGEPQELPSRIEITWDYLPTKPIEKTTRTSGSRYCLNQLNIFDNELYRKLNNAGNKKKKIVKEWVENQ